MTNVPHDKLAAPRWSHTISLKVVLRPDQRDALDALAARHGVSRERAIGDAIDNYLLARHTGAGDWRCYRYLFEEPNHGR